jgi:hypothetical protein
MRNKEASEPRDGYVVILERLSENEKIDFLFPTKG